MALTDSRIRAAKPRQKPYKLGDGDGLWLYVNPNGRRLWRFRYRRPGTGADTMLGFGPYPEIGLGAAREKALAARRLLVDRKDPGAEKKTARDAQANTFAAVAKEWLGKQQLADVTRDKADWLFAHVLPDIGSRPIAELTPPEVLRPLLRIEASGKLETAHRVKQRIGQVMRYAISHGLAERDVTADLRGALKAVVATNHASLTDPAKVGDLLRSIDGYVGQPATHAALRLSPLVFLRPGELRAAEWSEFTLDGEAPEWRVPGERMKMGELHVVPLAKQAVAILRELEPLTGRGKYVFPSLRTRDRPMSNNTVNAALRRLGYSGEDQTAHGFRSMASTLLNEQGWHPDLIELQLAHAERNKVRAAYNKAQRLAERRKMMQAWADYLDGLRAGGKVTPIRRGA